MLDNNEKNEKHIHLDSRVFPLLDVIGKPEEPPQAINYLGTCFLTHIANNHVFITAKHILNMEKNAYNLHIGFSTTDNHAELIKVNALYTNYIFQDVSFFIPSPEMRALYENKIIPTAALKNKLNIGQGVFVYGFANSHQTVDMGGVPTINILRNKYKGKVIGYEYNCPLPPMELGYQLDLPSPRGLSGAPVFVLHNLELVVVGYIIGCKTSNGKPFAISTDATPFIEIEKLLIEVSEKLKFKNS